MRRVDPLLHIEAYLILIVKWEKYNVTVIFRVVGYEQLHSQQ